MSNIDELIEQLRKSADFEDYPIVASFAAIIEKKYLREAADALEKLQAELNAAKSPEVLEAVDELMEFARIRMGIAEWLYYVDVLGEWRGQKKN